MKEIGDEIKKGDKVRVVGYNESGIVKCVCGVHIKVIWNNMFQRCFEKEKVMHDLFSDILEELDGI